MRSHQDRRDWAGRPACEGGICDDQENISPYVVGRQWGSLSDMKWGVGSDVRWCGGEDGELEGLVVHAWG